MALFVDESETIEVRVCFTEEKDGSLVFHDGAPPEGASIETMIFRKPNWLDTQRMTADIFIIDEAGRTAVNPYKFMDARFRVLLKEWSLKKKDGQPLPVSQDGINKLKPSLIRYVNSRLDDLLTAPTA